MFRALCSLGLSDWHNLEKSDNAASNEEFSRSEWFEIDLITNWLRETNPTMSGPVS